jgi:hypothetical protein
VGHHLTQKKWLSHRFVHAGLVTRAELDGILADMERDTLNLENLVLGPRMSLVWARKPD